MASSSSRQGDSIRSPEFQEWDLMDVKNHDPQRCKSNNSNSAGSPARETPELKTLEVATRIMSSEQSVKSIREGFLNVIRQASGVPVDTAEAERILELISGKGLYRGGPAAAGGPQRGTPEFARHTIERELQETAKMGPRQVEQRSTPVDRTTRYCDPTCVAQEVKPQGGQAPCTFSSTKSDHSMHADTKKPKPRVGYGKERKILPADLIRQLPMGASKKATAKVVQSASSAFSQRSDGSINAASGGPRSATSD